MDTVSFSSRKLINTLQSLALIAALALLVSFLGWRIAGPGGPLMAAFAIGLSLLLNPSWSPQLVLRLFHARPLQEPWLQQQVASLAARAGLPAVPALYYIPGTVLNAFTLGTPQKSAIAVTDGLLRSLDRHELHAVLAHEISHIRNNDMWVMGLAELFSRMTALFSLTGQFLLLINLPLLLLTDIAIDWFTILLLLFAPAFSLLIQLALSRLREYDADMDGAALCGEPLALARALYKIERSQGGLWERLLRPGRELPEPSMLRTHPPTAERIRRLYALARHYWQ